MIGFKQLDVLAAGTRCRLLAAVVGPYLPAPTTSLNGFHGPSPTRLQVAGIAALLLAAPGIGRQR
jgi:hypothetical protein